MVPVETSVPTTRYQFAYKEDNNQPLNHELDLLDEKRERASVQITAYKQKIAQYYNKDIQIRTFQIGDWVMRKVF